MTKFHQSLLCPKCGSGHFIAHGKRYALYPVGCVAVSLPLAWVHQASTPHEFECRDCGHRFARRTRPAKAALAALFIGLGCVLWWLVRQAF